MCTALNLRIGGFCFLSVLASCASVPDARESQLPPVDIVDHRVWFEVVEAGDTELARLMLDQGIDPSIELSGLTALHIAARDGNVDLVQLLIDRGADINLGPDPEQAQLAAVAGHGSPQMIELVMGRELEPGEVAQTMNLRTPLNLAVENGHVDVARTLIESGADVNMGGAWYSPLHTAVLSGDVAMIELMLESNARVNTSIRIHDRPSFAGFRYVRPLELARLIERDDIVDLLRSHGARD